jgi:anaerobic glycerol-3-phosphate dehydrogenase
MHYDIIIIGMGLSGLMAAKTAVDMGKKVLIFGKGVGSLSLFSNTIDVLGSISKTMRMEPHKRAPDNNSKVRWGEHPVPEDQFTPRQPSGPLGTGMSETFSRWIIEWG